jgi:phosphate transport system substrate-binding protein
MTRSFSCFINAGIFLLLHSCNSGAGPREDSPTSGHLKVYYDEGLQLHVQNQAYTFEALYGEVSLDLVKRDEGTCIQALYNDSCESIVVSRLLNETEKNAFAAKGYFPKYSKVAVSGVALITNAASKIKRMTPGQIKELLASGRLTDSSGQANTYRILFNAPNSSVLHYITDSLLRDKKGCVYCEQAVSTPDCIEKVAGEVKTLGFIDFAWLSDVDDSLFKKYENRIQFIAIGTADGNFELPSQSSFKTGLYPFRRNVYVMRKTGDFTIAKGFESFVAGPKGQLTFLKQGLLPARQAERSIHVKKE